MSTTLQQSSTMNVGSHSSRDDANSFESGVLGLLERLRGINVNDLKLAMRSRASAASISSPSKRLISISSALKSLSEIPEAETLDQVIEKVVDKKAFGGLGLGTATTFQAADYDHVLELTEAWLESLNSQDKAQSVSSSTIDVRFKNTRPMNLAQKIFAYHAIGGCPVEGLATGDVIRVAVDWILASELSWNGMAATYEELGSPGIWRNDRFWLAGDHVVHPDVMKVPKIQAMVNNAEKAKKTFKMTEYQGMNYTIMHTEFVRERAEPGMFILGSDSHTCSAGAVGCLSIGLGVADVTMALSTGETWFKIPESILITFTGIPSFAMSGKDVILYILKELKRNTVAAERIVEFDGEGLRYLSGDARFAICNMCTEFGAITGLFVPDMVTAEYISRRRRKANRVNSMYFKPDDGAEYAGKYTIDLSKVEASIAVYPNPDDVVPVSEKAGMQLDGVFIGACTTTEEELVLAALVLKAGLQKGLPFAKGKRHYVPGSLPIVEKLGDLGLLQIYEAAGFTRGPPGCSYCVGLSAEKAAEGETWLSSQNRNFQNRMGKGAIGSITSAIVCAASSFSMSVTDPAPFLQDVDKEFFRVYKNPPAAKKASVIYVEPAAGRAPARITTEKARSEECDDGQEPTQSGKIDSKIVVLEDFIDTDALSPGHTLTSSLTDEERGEHVLEHTHPEFRAKVRGGQRVVVAGNAFGVGSSRETAVSALKGIGVQAVIARSFAFIYGRNQPSLGLLGISMSNDGFFEVATEGEEISIDVPTRTIRVGGKDFKFRLAEMEYRLTMNKGITEAYKRYGKAIWEKLTESDTDVKVEEEMVGKMTDKRLDW